MQVRRTEDGDLLEVHGMVGATLRPVLHLDPLLREPRSDAAGGRALA
jgi:hypothetical protein